MITNSQTNFGCFSVCNFKMNSQIFYLCWPARQPPLDAHHPWMLGKTLIRGIPVLDLRLTILLGLGLAQRALNPGISRLRNLSTEEFLGSGFSWPARRCLCVLMLLQWSKRGVYRIPDEGGVRNLHTPHLPSKMSLAQKRRGECVGVSMQEVVGGATREGGS